MEVGPRDGFQAIGSVHPDGDPRSTSSAHSTARACAGSRSAPSRAPRRYRSWPTRRICCGRPATSKGLDPQVLVPTERRALEALDAGLPAPVLCHLGCRPPTTETTCDAKPFESVEEYVRLIRRLPEGVAIRLNLATDRVRLSVRGSDEAGGRRSTSSRASSTRCREPRSRCAIPRGGCRPTHVKLLFRPGVRNHAGGRVPELPCPRHLRPRGRERARGRFRPACGRSNASVAGLGGCPFAPGATGNVATEDLLWTFDPDGDRHRGAAPRRSWRSPTGQRCSSVRAPGDACATPSRRRSRLRQAEMAP